MATNTGGVDRGRAMFDKLHTRAKDRQKADKPKRGTGTVAAGKALYENNGKYAPLDVQVGEAGSDV